MSSLSKTTLIGNLGKDPEIKMTPNGTPVVRFSLATTENWKNAQGEKQSKTQWHQIIVWGKQAEAADKLLRKGKQVLVEGRIQYGEYTDKEGIRRHTTTIRCDSFQMLGKLEGPKAGEPQSDEALPSTPAPGGYDNEDEPGF